MNRQRLAGHAENRRDQYEAAQLIAAGRKLVDLWRRRAEVLLPYAPPAAAAWTAAADELEARLHIPPADEVLRQLLQAIGQELVADLRAALLVPLTAPEGARPTDAL